MREEVKAMKNIFLILILSLTATIVHARDTVAGYSIAEAMALEQTKEALGTQVTFYFGNQEHGAIEKKFGEFRTNKKTNAFNKSDEAACQWAFLSALLSLRDRAVKEGGNAVINVKSNYKGNLVSSEEQFQCGAGAVMAGVALVGDVVTLAE